MNYNLVLDKHALHATEAGSEIHRLSQQFHPEYAAAIAPVVGSPVYRLAERLEFLELMKPRKYRGWPLSSGPAYQVHVAGLLAAQTRSWLRQAIDELEKLRDIPVNWNSYGAEPPNNVALLWSRLVLEAAANMGLPKPHIAPSAENGVGVAFSASDKYTDIECLNSEEILAVRSDRTGNPHVWSVDVSEQGIHDALKVIDDYLNQ